MDAITLLTEDHRKVDDLFERFEQSSDPAERGELVATMVEELSVHAGIEEQELYPVMRRVLSSEDQVEEAEHEHAEAKALLAALVQLDPSDEHLEPLVEELMADVRHHVEEEEDELFPQLRDRMSAAELDDLGQRLEKARADAPTKPSAADLMELTREELYDFARKIGFEGRSDMNKDELAAALAPPS